MDLVDEHERAARNQRLLGEQGETAHEVVEVARVRQGVSGLLVLVKVQFEADVELAASELANQVALANLARADHEKGFPPRVFAPLEQFFVEFTTQRHNMPL